MGPWEGERVCNLRQMAHGHGTCSRAKRAFCTCKQHSGSGTHTPGAAPRNVAERSPRGRLASSTASLPARDCMVCGGNKATSISHGSALGHFISFLEKTVLWGVF